MAPWLLGGAVLIATSLLATCAGFGSSDGPPPEDGDKYAQMRAAMVEDQLASRDVSEPAVLEALGSVPRHEFVPDALRDQAYHDSPLPIGLQQTISQPYIVALMTQLSRAAPGMKALDVGTGSGYQAAVLAELVDHVYSIEILCELADQAESRLDRLGYENITVRCGDGYAGWPEQAPFDVIIVAAAPENPPPPLIQQLAPGGRLVIPLGNVQQDLVVFEKSPDGEVRSFTQGGVRFVPMTGQAEEDR